MRQFRFSIASLLGVVLFVGVGIAALRAASDPWDSGVFGGGKLLTGAAGTSENFVRIGHSFIALVMALLGGQLSRALRAGCEPAPIGSEVQHPASTRPGTPDRDPSHTPSIGPDSESRATASG